MKISPGGSFIILLTSISGLIACRRYYYYNTMVDGPDTYPHSCSRYIEGQSFEVKKGQIIEGTYVEYDQGGMMVDIHRKVSQPPLNEGGEGGVCLLTNQ